MAYKNILASSISFKEHLNVFDRIFAERLDSLDLTCLLIYLIDNTEATALSNLADQFNVLGYKGWFMATNDDERRTLLKEAIKRKRYSGTPWAVREALKGVGYGESEIREGYTVLYDGTFKYDGSLTYGSNSWAFFTVENIDLGENKGYQTSDLTLIRNLIEIYKRQAAHLVSVGPFTSKVEDEILISEEFEITIRNASDEIIYQGE